MGYTPVKINSITVSAINDGPQIDAIGIDTTNSTPMNNELPTSSSLSLSSKNVPTLNNSNEEMRSQPRTSYTETIVHLFKGNIGPGLFAMGDAFKNGGLVVAPILTLVIALISVHCQHILLKCSERMRVLNNADKCADYAETVEQCFSRGPKKLRSWALIMRMLVNVFICVTQLGFCCIYFVFISTNMKQIFEAHNININVQLVMVISFVPILLTSLITNLKWLTPISMVANCCMVIGLGITLYYALKDGLPYAGDRVAFTNPFQLALFFGTAIFAFEGIALVLPLKNAMNKPQHFDRPLGVLNVGMLLVTGMFMFSGFVGYLKWGDDVGGSLTLNLGDTMLAQLVKLMVSTGVLLGYALQFFIVIQIMWPQIQRNCNLAKRPLIGEMLFRGALVLLTLFIAELVPALSVFISLIGSLCSTALALVFPPMIELLLLDNKKGPTVNVFLKNIIILLLGLLGFLIGTYESVSQIIKHFSEF